MAVPNLWRTKKQRYSLHGEVCGNCSQVAFPPREICPYCHKPMQQVVAKTHPMVAAHIVAQAAALTQPALQPALMGDD